jgi:hypothetical protein
LNRTNGLSLICGFLISSSVVFIVSCNESKSTITSHERTVCLSQEDRDAAKYALDTLSLTTKEVPDLARNNDGEKVRYSFLDAWWTEENNPPLYLAMHRIADYDACIEGYARRIEFHSAKGDHLGYADPVEGLKPLVDPTWRPSSVAPVQSGR